MSFSSSLFLFIFFPIAFLTFYIIPNKIRKLYLLTISILFYTLQSLKTLPILFISIIVNYFLGFVISKYNKKRLFLWIGIIFNVLLLVFYKYTSFIFDSFNSIFSTNLEELNLLVPLGISFFTFQEISYIVDVYSEKIKFDKNIINFALYICFFPRIISGPIVRYEQFNESIENISKPKIDAVYVGIKRMCIGLGKILILSNVMGEVWSLIFVSMDITSISILTAWFGIICYSLYIYMDFSGYTDVAIGVGNLFGIKLPENFDYPYCSQSISEFWRRWHITLSTWFRNYIYIPLGGNKKGNVYINIFIVFLLTGLWHGASWNFIFWGIYHGIWRIIEKCISNNKIYIKIPVTIKRIMTYIIVIIGWVLFASGGVQSAIKYYQCMFGVYTADNAQYGLGYFLNLYNVFFIVVCIICSLPIKNMIYKKIENEKLKEIISGICTLLVLVISILFLINSSYKPFIYAQF